MSLAATCEWLMELRVQRNACLRARIRIDNAAVAMLRRAFGEAPVPGARISRAQKAWSRLLTQKPLTAQDAADADLVLETLKAFAVSRAAMQDPIDRIEKEMLAQARLVDMGEFVSGVRGFSLMGVAAIIGETGDLRLYPHPRMVWKRLGLMPWNGAAGSNCASKGLSADDWTRLGYVPRRRAAMRVLEEALLKHQIEAAGKSETAFGRPTGRYGEVYVARRERNARERPDWTPGHSKDDASRIMIKTLVSDVWSEWRRQHIKALELIHQVAAVANSLPPSREAP